VAAAAVAAAGPCRQKMKTCTGARRQATAVSSYPKWFVGESPTPRRQPGTQSAPTRAPWP